MVWGKISKITDKFNKMGKMAFLEGATDEQISEFEKTHKICLPMKYKEWLLFSDGGEIFLPAGVQFYGVAHKPLIDVNDDDRPSKDFVVIGALASGDPIVFENNKEIIAIYNHEADKIEEDEIYNDFEAFLDDINNILGIQGGSYVK